ncbi:sugar phosphate isomerase/epimerase family protein [Pseudomonas sp. PDM14]|uniref:sugar phosphate isomerase/epimerase family protein n=1 Tax=Pseudomonas sp. PDM14 TaxID=2769288 RepID=UPI001CE1C2F8|nr:TIM barrel protein [Pseudomonas sp. PDM14]
MDIGFMQGRLCDRVDGKIQAFPWPNWEKEFPVAQQLGISLMEWTLDQERLHENPLMSVPGRQRIRELSMQYGVRILSLTGDCFMQAPFFKASGTERDGLLLDLRAIVDSAADLGIRYVLIPLVDNGSLTSPSEERALLEGLLPLHGVLTAAKLKIVFESDFAPERLARFIERFPGDAFGLNYDIGNSAALGYSASEEISCYGHRIDNVHVKDRVLGGTTVPLGSGNANFPEVFRALHSAGYTGNFILQTARADDDHAGAIDRYRAMTSAWWHNNES